MSVGSLSNLFRIKLVGMISSRFLRKETGMISISLFSANANSNPQLSNRMSHYRLAWQLALITQLYLIIFFKNRCVSSRLSEEILAVWRRISLQLKKCFCVGHSRAIDFVKNKTKTLEQCLRIQLRKC